MKIFIVKKESSSGKQQQQQQQATFCKQNKKQLGISHLPQGVASR